MGCTKCLNVCPVGAITGARKTAHVVNESTCTACGDCLPVCPIDTCIVWNDGTPFVRPPKTKRTTSTPTLPAELLAKITAARATANHKFTVKKGPLNQPKALRTKEAD